MMASVTDSAGDLSKINAADGGLYEMQRENDLFHVQDPATGKSYQAVGGVRTDGDGYVVFCGANEVFFNTPGELRSKKQHASSDPLNQHAFFCGIDNIVRRRDAMFWPLFVRPGGEPASADEPAAGGGGGAKAGFHAHFDAKLRLQPAKGRKVPGGVSTPTFVVCVDGDEEHALEVVAVPSNTHYAFQFDVQHMVPGFHTLEVWLRDTFHRSVGPGMLCYLKATCASRQLAVVRERWRPLATHIRFRASQASRTSAWVMAQRKVGPKPWLSSYNPMTTPYGYAGFSLSGEGRATTMNFSLWSYGKGQPMPPMYRLSRLLGCGHPTATFSHFGHEGHGEKFRNWTGQWDGNVSREYVTYQDYRQEPDYVYADGKVYSFRSFFWDESAADPDGSDVPGRWRFYAEGQKFFGGRQRNLSSLPIGSFIEVPGPADRQRSGHVTRAVSYRGFARDKKTGVWRVVDRMQNFPGTLTNKVWRADGSQFFASAGGLEYRRVTGPRWLELEKPPAEEAAEEAAEEGGEGEAPEFPLGIGMSDEEIANGEDGPDAGSLSDEEPLYMQRIHHVDVALPYPRIAGFRLTADKMVSLDVSIPEKEHAESEVVVYWGKKDCLTLMRFWDAKTQPVEVSGQQAVVLLPPLEAGQTYYARVLVRDAGMQLFSRDTFRFTA